jgi:hypothetical protein
MAEAFEKVTRTDEPTPDTLDCGNEGVLIFAAITETTKSINTALPMDLENGFLSSIFFFLAQNRGNSHSTIKQNRRICCRLSLDHLYGQWPPV